MAVSTQFSTEAVMLRFVGDVLQTSITDLVHPHDRHCIRFVSCVHLGDPGYYEELQRLIDAWDGVVFEEKLTGDSSLFEKVPWEKKGLQSYWRKFHALQRLASQRLLLKYPAGRTVNPDISWEEMVRYFDTVPPLCSVSSREEAKRIVDAFERVPDAAYAVLWFALRGSLGGLGLPPESATYRNEWGAVRDFFAGVRNNLVRGGAAKTVLWVYDFICHTFACEPVTSFVPERDTAVVRNIDEERTGAKRNILVVYGGGHYRGIVNRLYDRGYAKTKQEWLPVCTCPAITYGDFKHALGVIAKELNP